MQPLAPELEARSGEVYNEDGVPCMVVLDPATRKLLIPCCSIFPTRAQRRATIPSLCQLFLLGRCRQGAECHQVHAGPGAVAALRGRVGCLPRCCPLHGDMGISSVCETHPWLSNVYVHIPESNYENGYIPLHRIGYTIPIYRMLQEISEEDRNSLELCRQSFYDDGQTPMEAPLVILEANDVFVCRLHYEEHCLFAEECNFLHLCKEVVRCDPELRLGRRSRRRSAQMMQTSISLPLSTSESQGNIHMDSKNHSMSAQYRTLPCTQQTQARGFCLFQSSEVYRERIATQTYIHGKSRSRPDYAKNTLGSYCTTNNNSNTAVNCGALLAHKPKTSLNLVLMPTTNHHGAESHPPQCATDAVHTTTTTTTTNNNNNNNKSASAYYTGNCCDISTSIVSMEGINSPASNKSENAGDAVYMRPIFLRDLKSDSIAASSRDEGISTSSMNLSGSFRQVFGDKWRHDPYNISAVRMLL